MKGITKMRKFRIVIGALALTMMAAIIVGCNKEKNETNVAQQATGTEEIAGIPAGVLDDQQKNGGRGSSFDNSGDENVFHACINQLAQDTTYSNYYDFTSISSFRYNDTTNSYVYAMQSVYFPNYYLTVIVDSSSITGMYITGLPTDHSIEYYVNHHESAYISTYTVDEFELIFSGYANFSDNTFCVDYINYSLFDGKRPKKDIVGLICNLGIGSAGIIWSTAFSFVPVWGWAAGAVIGLGTIVGSYYAC